MHTILAYYGLMIIKLIMAIGVAVIYLRYFTAAGNLKQMTALDIIINFLLSAILSDFILDRHIGIMDFVIIVTIYGVLLYALSKLTLYTNVGRRIFIGTPHVIIQNGKLDTERMARLNISAHDLAMALRRQQIQSIHDVETAEIEPNGDFTIVKKGDRKYSVVIIDNGNIDKFGLAKIQKNEKWLRTQLRRKKIKDIDDILIAQWHRGRLQIVKK